MPLFCRGPCLSLPVPLLFKARASVQTEAHASFHLCPLLSEHLPYSLFTLFLLLFLPLPPVLSFRFASFSSLYGPLPPPLPHLRRDVGGGREAEKRKRKGVDYGKAPTFHQGVRGETEIGPVGRT